MVKEKKQKIVAPFFSNDKLYLCLITQGRTASANILKEAVTPQKSQVSGPANVSDSLCLMVEPMRSVQKGKRRSSFKNLKKPWRFCERSDEVLEHDRDLLSLIWTHSKKTVVCAIVEKQTFCACILFSNLS